MKIKTIEVKNFKAIDNQIADFDGCSAIITAGNNKGKTSLLKGLIDRFHSEKPEIILKEGEEKGFNIIELTDGSKIEWKFTEKTESFAFITKEGIKMTTGVIKAIGNKYFGLDFDIDEFLNSTPQQKTRQLQKLIGIDLTELDIRYKEAFEDRTILNRELNAIGSKNLQKPDPVEKPNIEDYENQLTEIRVKNSEIKEKWIADNNEHLKELQNFNIKQGYLSEEQNKISSCIDYLATLGFESQDLYKFCEEYKPQKLKEIKSLPEPDYISEFEINQKIKEANEQSRKYDAYDITLCNYNEWVKEGKSARENAEKADQKVKEIEAEKKKIIESAKLPEGFEFTENGINYNGFPLDSNQISSSQKYIAGLKLGAMVLGDIKTLHFDASFLDKNSLSEVQSWAEKNDYQLLIERPDFEGGEIKYQII